MAAITKTESTITGTTKLVRPLRGGQMTIPAEFRRALDIDAETMFRVTLTEGSLQVTPVKVAETHKGSPWLRELYEYYAPVREEILARGISEEEVNADIDAAITAVRAEQRAKRQ
jgi:bifunctional DNA-binding transcriptional regulator/antitoxin component of YhaV-PrlF toxin-antitoxin module